MIKVRIISIGRVKQSFVLEGEKEYLKRLTGSVSVLIEEISPAKKARTEEAIKLEEAHSLLNQLKSSDFLIVLDENGKHFSSETFSGFLSKKMNEGVSTFHFAIGGAFGWHDSVRERADFVLSLSSLTFPYQLTRLILVEQLYRASSLIQGSPYHKA